MVALLFMHTFCKFMFKSSYYSCFKRLNVSKTVRLTLSNYDRTKFRKQADYRHNGFLQNILKTVYVGFAQSLLSLMELQSFKNFKIGED